MPLIFDVAPLGYETHSVNPTTTTNYHKLTSHVHGTGTTSYYMCKSFKMTLFVDDADHHMESASTTESPTAKKKTKRITRFEESSDDSDHDEGISQDINYSTKGKSPTICPQFSDFESDDDIGGNKVTKSIEKKLRKRLARIAESSDESDDESDFAKTKVLEEEESKNILHDDEDVINKQHQITSSANGLDVLKPKIPETKALVSSVESNSSSSDDEDLNVPCDKQHSFGIVPTCSNHSDVNDDSTDKTSKIQSESEGNDSDIDSAISESESSDDDSPPLRIFRNKDAAAINSRGYDSGNDLSSDEERDGNEYSTNLPHVNKPRKRPGPSNLEIKSETQRLIRESNLNLPYYVPETKKLSQFLKRPIGFQETLPVCEHKETPTEPSSDEVKLPNIQQSDDLSQEELRDSGIGLNEANTLEKNEDTPNKDEPEAEAFATPAQRKKAKLLASHGITLPTLNAPKAKISPRQRKDFVDLDENVKAETPNTGVSKFMERFLKHSSAQKSASSKKKKVQFNIVRKEERVDGTGVDLVSDVITATEESKEETDDFSGTPSQKYQSFRQKLAEKMKQRRLIERKKREELYQLDNEEIGKVEEEEEELDDDWSDIDSEEEGYEESEEKKVKDLSKNHIIDDEEEEESKGTGNDLEEDDDATQPVPPEATLSNGSTMSKTSQATAKSDILFPHLSSEGSLLLFDDTIKKPNSSNDDDHTYDPLYGSMIPPNQPEISDISDSSKPCKLSYDDDSYFCSERSTNISTNESQSRTDCDSQFLDSDGFIKEPKTSKSLTSLLPVDAEDDNANDCNMSQLLELCSGKFQESGISQTESFSEIAAIDESFGFQIEPAKFISAEPTNFSDEENISDPEDAGITIIRRKKDVTQRMMRNFLEEEAELSGDDVGSDDDCEGNEKDNYYEEEENDEILPREEVMQRQVNKVHLKQLLDEDQRDIELLQEAFVEEAIELKRNRKFKWKNIDNNFTQDNFLSDDDENDSNHDNESREQELRENGESQWRMLRLEREEFLNSKTSDQVIEDDSESRLLQMGKAVIKRPRVLSEINEDSKGTKTPTLSRSNSLTTSKLPSRNSFLCRKPEILEKFANYKEATVLKGAINSDRMVFKALSPSNKIKHQKARKAPKCLQSSKRPRIDEDSNSVFDLFDS
ncbi:claspin-like isoform X2 [Clavelina lepadiformis]|uniref:claspin-like isoform X2 n=1 Tax=Clavelina lepadiformis TaxID=159417 RepID=UPI004042C134